MLERRLSRAIVGPRSTERVELSEGVGMRPRTRTWIVIGLATLAIAGYALHVRARKAEARARCPETTREALARFDDLTADTRDDDAALATAPELDRSSIAIADTWASTITVNASGVTVKASGVSVGDAKPILFSDVSWPRSFHADLAATVARRDAIAGLFGIPPPSPESRRLRIIAATAVAWRQLGSIVDVARSAGISRIELIGRRNRPSPPILTFGINALLHRGGLSSLEVRLAHVVLGECSASLALAKVAEEAVRPSNGCGTIVPGVMSHDETRSLIAATLTACECDTNLEPVTSFRYYGFVAYPAWGTPAPTSLAVVGAIIDITPGPAGLRIAYPADALWGDVAPEVFETFRLADDTHAHLVATESEPR